jgi:hypothetical protein
LDGQIFINQPLPVLQIVQVAECPAALVNIVAEVRLSTDCERRVPVEHAAQQVVPLRGEPTIKTGGFLCMVWRGIYLAYVFSNLFRLL